MWGNLFRQNESNVYENFSGVISPENQVIIKNGLFE